MITRSIVIFAWLLSVAVNAAELPIEHFVMLPDVEAVELSPSGNKLATLKRANHQGKRLLVIEITNLLDGKKSYPLVRKDKEFDIYQMIWADDGHILLKIDYFKRLFIHNAGWNPRISQRRLMVLNLENQTVKSIISGAAFNRFQSQGWEPQIQDDIVDLLPNEPGFILHALDWNTRLAPQVFKVNLDTLERQVVKTQERGWHHWITDQQYNVRAATELNLITGGLEKDRTEHRVHVNLPKKGWTELWRFSDDDSNFVQPIGFLKDPNLMLVLAQFEGRDAIYKVDLRKPLEKELFYHSEGVNVGSRLFYSNLSKEPVGYRTGSGVKFWDANYQKIMDSINKALPNTKNNLKYFSQDERKYLVYSSSGSDSGSYYLGDREKKSLEPIAYTYLALDPAELVIPKSYRVDARDGDQIKVYVSTPKNAKATPLPTILYAHQRQDSATAGGFDFRAQFLANRGYRVIQVNFRAHGSGNFNFMYGGLTQWSTRVQQDLDDVLQWAISEQLTDKDKVCLFGQQYGGYAALMAAAKSPEKYQCVVTFGAMTDIQAQVASTEGFTSHLQTIARLSDVTETQIQYSPVSYAKNFDAAVLLVHGTEDSHIRVDQGVFMHQALIRAGKKSTYLEIDNEDSVLTSDDSRLRVYTAVESFFETHLR